jgi:acyl CoA:acetate/3-ketoacid CoA transferase alpha subunit/acyl CoA:acetate/3-ketoacid CoA transferase beta subunit
MGGSIATNKVMALEDAIRLIVPGDHIHASLTGGRPNAALRAVAKAHWHDKPQFTLSSTGIGGPQLGLVLLGQGLLKHVIAGFVGHQYPSPGPYRVAQRMIAEGDVTLEAWSLLTVLERLRAGARGVRWTVTRSLDHDSLHPTDHEGSSVEGVSQYRTIRMTEGDELRLIPWLRPDVTLLHGLIGDEDGNIVLGFPYGEGVLGAFAARRGAIATVERLVSKAELRRYSHLPIVPSVAVASVSLVRWGSHPAGIYGDAVDRRISYSDDYSWLAEMVEALNAGGQTLERWTDHWILEPSDPREYVQRLEDRRTKHLRTWWRRRPDSYPTPDAAPMSSAERMILTGAQILQELWQKTKPQYVFAGIGSSSLAVWLARKESISADAPLLITELGFYDYEPTPGDPWLFSFANLSSCAALTDSELMLALIVQGKGEVGSAVLAAAQIDQHGHLNSSWVEGRWLTGSGGANDVAATIADITVLIPHNSKRLVADVEYVTSPGTYVKRIVTDYAVLERDPDASAFLLTGVIEQDEQRELEELIADIEARTPWPVGISQDVRLLERPGRTRLDNLRRLDPAGVFTSGSRGYAARMS